jgi:hypothetical protein
MMIATLRASSVDAGDEVGTFKSGAGPREIYRGGY